MSRIFTCTPDCAGRKPGCHDHCKKYQREKSEWERQKANDRRNRIAEDYTINVIARRSDSEAKRRKNNLGRKRYRRY